MTTSVTISDELRRKIKQLAAIFDTSQAEIIERAIREFEAQVFPKDGINDPKLIEYLSKLSKKVHEKNPDRKRRFEKLTGPGIQIEDVLPAFWERVVEE